MVEEPKLTVREYGSAVMVTKEMMDQAAFDPMELITQALTRQRAELDEVLAICGDAEIVNPFEIKKGPAPDVMRRFHSYGWYMSFTSKNYETMKKHFECKRRHIPNEITLEFINEMIERYAQQQIPDDEDY